MSRDEDDRYSGSVGIELRLQFKTGHAWQADVSDQARSVVSGVGLEELFGEVEAESIQPLRFEQILECVPKRLVILDDCDEFRALPTTHERAA